MKTIYPLKNLYATGGGAYKFNNLVHEILNVNMVKHDELISLVNGYILMNEMDTFFEYTSDGYKFVGSDDFVITNYLLKSFILFEVQIEQNI